MPLPSLPPAYHLIALDGEVAAFERAVRAAPRGIDDGTVYWTEREDRLEMAIVLEPELPARRALESVYVLTVATGDALEQLLPQVAVAFAWPGDLIVDEAKIGFVQVALAPVAADSAAPPWLALGLTVKIRHLKDSLRTSAPTAVELVESVTRNLLRWSNLWQAGGLDELRVAWNRRCFRRGEIGRLAVGDRHLEGWVAGLTADGHLAVGEHRLRLVDALAVAG